MKLEYDLPQKVNMDAAKLNELDDLVRRGIENDIGTGMSAIVVRHGKIVYHKTIGNLTLDPDSPPAPLNTIHPVMSVSKTATAACIMILQDRNLLSVNDPVQKYIPEFTGKGKSRVKIRHLLTHTSGMFDDGIYQYCQQYCNATPLPETPPAYLGKTKGGQRWWLCVLSAPLMNPTGKEMSYSSIGYNMLGMIVEIVSGMGLDAFAKKNIFKPLGMKDTSYKKTKRQLEGRVIQRKPAPGEKENWLSSPRCFNRVRGSGSLSTTAYDLAIYGQMFLNGGEYDGKRILSPKSVKLMTTNQIPGIPAQWGEEHFDEAAWSYGFNTIGVQNNFPTNRSYYHGGYAGSQIMIDPVLDLIIVSLRSLNFIEEKDYDDTLSPPVQACLDYDQLKTDPLP